MERSSPDGDADTTHVRCGSDIRERLAIAGFAGSFVEFSDPICQGPVPQTDDLIGARARYLADRYGVELDEMAARLRREMTDLAETTSRERVVLWFEHDSYDQLILARVLAFYLESGSPERLELISVDGFPGIDRFLGLGQLTPDQLGFLWPLRRPVVTEMLEHGSLVWEALRDPSPLGLHGLTDGPEALGLMGGAVTRHLRELPWTTDRLGLTERLTLGLLDPGPSSERLLFRRLTQDVEPLPFLGDTMHAAILDDLAAAERAPIRITPGGDAGDRRVALTKTGRRLLRGQLTWAACAPRERWVGGVRISPGSRVWCWDPDAERPVLA